MLKLQNSEELAREAIKFLELAQKFEEEKNAEKAISHYQKAAEFLKQSGFLMHRIKDVYGRIEALNNYLKQDQLIQHTQEQTKVEKLQDQAFALLEGAKKFEFEGFLEDAIQQYMSAITLLIQSGWSEVSLENLKLKIKNLTDDIKRQKLMQQDQQKELELSEEYTQTLLEKKSQVAGFFGEKASADKVKSIEKFRAQKKLEEDLQNQAFDLIDKAKMFEKEKKFENAIMNYERAIELLNSIGWNAQTQNIQTILKKLRKEKEYFESYQLQQEKVALYGSDKIKEQKDKIELEKMLKRDKLIKFEDKKIKEEEIQAKAFNLIDMGNRLERENNYSQALETFDQAIQLLTSIEWDAYIPPIIKLIDDIKDKQKREKNTAQLKEKRKKNLLILQESLYMKQREKIFQSAKDLDIKKKEYEEKRKGELKKERDLFSTLDNADYILKEKNFDTALKEYHKALELLEDLGPDWKVYSITIKNTISYVQKLKDEKFSKEYEDQKKLENKEQEEIEFQKQISSHLKKERDRLKKKEIIIKDHEEKIKFFEQRKKEASEFLDSAKNSIKQANYENAILAYQNAGIIFAEIQWIDEIPLIENSIREVEELQKKQKILRQNKIQEAINKQREEEEFQKQIAKYLQQEREAIKRKKIDLRQREEEVKYHKKQRKNGFKLLEEAQDNIKQGNFDKAIEILQHAMNLFADIHWQSEINLIQNAIVEIENRKREAEIQKQIKFKAELKRYKRERLFQELIAKDMKAQREDLKQKEYVLRERRQELAYREKKKEEAFNLLDKAQEFLSQGEFDDAIELYHKVSNNFAKIQWIEELPIIHEAIIEIENKKRENNLYKQKLLQKTIKKEASDKVFLEKIKYYRESEKAEILKEKELLEKQKQFTSQNLVKQQKAFTMIESGDVLIQENNFNKAIENYQKSIIFLKEVGWGAEYLKILQETIKNIELRKKEKEKEKQVEYENALKHKKDEDLFEKKINEYIQKEKRRLKTKQIKLKKREEMSQQMENQRLQAFTIMDEGEILLNQREYDKSLEKYRQAELILNEINFPTGAIREMLYKILEKKREEDLNKLKELELRFRSEQDEQLFQQQISEKIELEKQKMRVKQEKLKKEEEFNLYIEQKKEDAFNLLEEAQKCIEKGEDEKAIEYYENSANIFKEIHWDHEINLIKNSIFAVENKKRESELRKQMDLKALLEDEKQEKKFQEELIKEMKIQSAKLKQKEIIHREQEKEIKYRESKKEEAFSLLEKAQNYLSYEKFDDAIEIYHDVANIFAQIQWMDEIAILHEAIMNIENKKREKNYLKQKLIQDAIEKEKANFAFTEQIRLIREREKTRAIEEKVLIEEKELINSQYFVKQQDAFKLIDTGFILLNQENYDKALENYKNAISILTEIGWTSNYLKLLKDIVKTIEIRKKEIEREKTLENELLFQQQKEEEQFQQKISEYMIREQKRLKQKDIEILNYEELKQLKEKRKLEAFGSIDEAEKALNQKLYNQAIEKYRQAELLLNEIGFPTQAVREMTSKVQEKSKEEIFVKQKKLEDKLHKEREEFNFQQQIRDNIRINEMKLKVRQIKLKKQREHQTYIEKRKEEAFNLLEEAEIFMKQTQYDKTLDYYYSAELILNKIAFPTELIRESIFKVQEKKRQHHLHKQKELEASLKEEKEEWEFQQKVTSNLNNEKERLKAKKLEIEKLEQLKLKLEEKKEQTFMILDEAEHFFKNLDYDNALKKYRKAEIMLNELQFPTLAIKNMIIRINNLKEQKEKFEMLENQKKLEKLEGDKILQVLIEERKRQEREKKKAQQLAIQERERVIQEQKSVRESAFSLLEEAGKYLKQYIPDYNKAISLYIQAKILLAENIGWEPEINNLDMLIKDLQEEQVAFIDKKRIEEQAHLQRQKEYEMFLEEVTRRRLDQEKLKRKQERQYRKLILKKQQVEHIKDEGLRLIDEGKKWAVYHDFAKAHKNLNMAIIKFREIGWDKEIRYIETEIKNTKVLEEKVKKEEARIESIQEQLEKQRISEKRRREIKDAKLKDSISEISYLADEVMVMIEKRKKEQKLGEKQKKEKIKVDAKEFRREMGQLIKIKQELIDELEKKEVEKRKFQEKIEKAKEREEIDNLKRMIKEASKDKKK